ncbi:MAG: hypothetical protein WCP92_05715 [bacterium]
MLWPVVKPHPTAVFNDEVQYTINHVEAISVVKLNFAEVHDKTVFVTPDT